MKKKIAIIDTLGAHGSSFHFYSFGQCIGLINSNFDVSLYTNNKTTNPNIEGLRFYSFYKDLFIAKSNFINGVRWIIGSIKSILHARLSAISVFHFHIFYSNILVFFNIILVKLLLGKVVITVHDVDSFSGSNQSYFLKKNIYRIADLILTHNEFSKSEILNLFTDLESKIRIVPHGNYTPFINLGFKSGESRDYLKLPQKKKILLFFGLIKEVKGLELLLEAFKLVLEKYPDIYLLIAGKAWKNDFTVYQNIIDKYKLSANCIIHNNFISHEDVPYYFSASDLVVLPYKKIYQSGVLLMAMSYEKPVLVSDLPALTEFIVDDKNGFVFKTNNIQSLANKLCSAISDDDNLEKVRQNGAELVRIKYNWNEIGRLTKKAYDAIF